MSKPDGRRMQLYSLKPISDAIIATNPKHEDFVPQSHLRWHPLRGEWVAYATHRQNRTFLPPKEYSPLAVTKTADFPTELPAGEYDIAVFQNLFPSMSMSSTEAPDLYVPAHPAKGVCEVVVFTQNPEASLGQLPIEQIALLLEVLGERTKEIGKMPEIQYVLPFENRGVEVGVTLHHPHGQIYAYNSVPPIPAKMQMREDAYYKKNGITLFANILAEEEKDGRRLIVQEGHATSFIPVCARYPYETWIAPKRSVPYLYDLNPAEVLDLARVLKKVLQKFDAMWERPFPYLMALYQAPTDKKPHPEAHLHFEIFPPYRSRDKLKFLAGTELGAGLFINDSVPEEKAAELRGVKIL